MHATDLRSTAPVRHGAYVCLTVPREASARVAAAPVAALVDRLRLRNEFEAGDPTPADSIAFLRRLGASAADLADPALLHADAVVHVASASADRVDEACAELGRLLGPASRRVLAGVVRPPRYTGDAMHDFAYAHRVVPQPGPVMPNAFLVPMCKTAAWWEKGWMERHTYFLPRYD